jgi:hypothetical protein
MVLVRRAEAQESDESSNASCIGHFPLPALAKVAVFDFIETSSFHDQRINELGLERSWTY